MTPDEVAKLRAAIKLLLSYVHAGALEQGSQDGGDVDLDADIRSAEAVALQFMEDMGIPIR